MFRHRGKQRTLVHNLKLASILSFVAGIVNVTGLFSIQRLTTNVTGHFAYFADEIVKNNLHEAWFYLLYIIFFFLGAFTSNLLIETMSLRNNRYVSALPIAAEISILLVLSLLAGPTIRANANLVACSLLFAMGLQNALVTSISNSVVRTTHLTGLFTDLGIEVSQLFFFKKYTQQKKLKSIIKLRLTIISFFFLGGITGGFFYLFEGIKSLMLAAFILFGGLIYDSLKLRLVTLKRKYR
ncbi:MAG TPA: YoaK family protein [Daejeonella sp.]|nr:YoaK family protein [Daejeonella sp.]